MGVQRGRVGPPGASSRKPGVAAPSPVPYSVHLQNDADSSVSEQQTFLVVVAIDFGTTSSGYAYSFTKEPECIHVMRQVLGRAGAGAGFWTLAQLCPNSLCHTPCVHPVPTAASTLWCPPCLWRFWSVRHQGPLPRSGPGLPAVFSPRSFASQGLITPIFQIQPGSEGTLRLAVPFAGSYHSRGKILGIFFTSAIDKTSCNKSNPDPVWVRPCPFLWKSSYDSAKGPAL